MKDFFSKITLGFKLESSRRDPPGEYIGTLYLSALNGFITWDISARLRLSAEGKQGQSGDGDDKKEPPESGSSDGQYGSPEQVESGEGDRDGTDGQIDDQGEPDAAAGCDEGDTMNEE